MDRERVGQFLRALVGLFTVAWLVVALFSPPDPFTFLVGLVAGWVVAVPVAAWLVFAGGYRTLRASPAYAPRTSASRAAGSFVLLAVALKLLLTGVANVLLGADAVGYGVGAAVSGVALVVAYAAVFLAGTVGRFDARRPEAGE
jgi:hypothetical protein